MRRTIGMFHRPMLGGLKGLGRKSIRTGSTTPHNRGLRIMRDRPEYMEYEHAARRGGIDALGQRHPPDAALFEIPGRGDQLLQRPGEPIELPHDQYVAPAQHVVEHAREFGPIGFGT